MKNNMNSKNKEEKGRQVKVNNDQLGENASAEYANEFLDNSMKKGKNKKR